MSAPSPASSEASAGARAEPAADVVFAYRRTGKFAFHVLAGALETDPAVAEVPVHFANGVDAVVDAASAARSAGRRVLVCWSFYSPDFALMQAELAAVRGRVDAAEIVHVAGGVHASAEPVATLRAGWDLVARGEGERLIRELVDTWQRGRDLRGVAGVAWLDDAGNLAGASRDDRIELDAFPPFAPGHRRHGPMRSRAAAFTHADSADAVLQQGALPPPFARQHVVLVAVSARDRLPRLPVPEPDVAVVRQRRPRPRPGRGGGAAGRGARDHWPDKNLFYGTFPSELRPEHVTPEVLALLARYVDNRTLILGGQSGSERVLERSARGHGVEEIERAAALCLEAGFRPHVDFIFGLPGERREDVDQTLALARRLAERGVRVHGHTFMPLPGTPFRGEAPAGSTPGPARSCCAWLPKDGSTGSGSSRWAPPASWPANGCGETARPVVPTRVSGREPPGSSSVP